MQFSSIVFIIDCAPRCFMHVSILMHSGLRLLVIFNVMVKFLENIQPYVYVCVRLVTALRNSQLLKLRTMQLLGDCGMSAFNWFISKILRSMRHCVSENQIVNLLPLGLALVVTVHVLPCCCLVQLFNM